MHATFIIYKSGRAYWINPVYTVICIRVTLLPRIVHSPEGMIIIRPDLLTNIKRAIGIEWNCTSCPCHCKMFDTGCPNITQRFVHSARFTGVHKIGSMAANAMSYFVSTNIQRGKRFKSCRSRSRAITISHRSSIPERIIICGTIMYKTFDLSIVAIETQPVMFGQPVIVNYFSAPMCIPCNIIIFGFHGTIISR